jgi:hypothetical protein
MTPEQRERISVATRAAMADPALREKISQRTTEGIRRAARELEPELTQLNIAWSSARPAVRKRFLHEKILSVVADQEGPRDAS